MSDETKIALHPEHGLNATIPMCHWCKKSKGGITPLGNRIERQAPPTAVLDYEPCMICKSKMLMGIAVIEMDSAEKLNQPEMIAGLAPTSRWFVLTEEQFQEMAIKLKLVDNHVIPILSNRRMLVEPDIYNAFIPKKKPKRQRKSRAKR